MCLYPKLILNRKYLPNKKNGGTPPKCPDERLKYVTAACGKCYECRKQKARGWLVRMEEELRHNPNAIFITLTLEDKWYKNIEKKYNIKGDNNIGHTSHETMVREGKKNHKKIHKTLVYIRNWWKQYRKNAYPRHRVGNRLRCINTGNVEIWFRVY